MLCQCKAMATKLQKGLQLRMPSQGRVLPAVRTLKCKQNQMCIMAREKRRDLFMMLAAQPRLRQAVK